jgi:hypothetical protein
MTKSTAAKSAESAKKPTVFIGSSTEGLKFARAARSALNQDAKIRIWNEGPFSDNLGSTFIETLLKLTDEFDFAILVLTPDEQVVSRDVLSGGARDNVVFELGLFMSHLGRQRTFVLRDKGVKLLSDLSGVNVSTFAPDSDGRDFKTEVAAACDGIRDAIQKLGPAVAPSCQRVASPTFPTGVRYLLQGVKHAYQDEIRRNGPPGGRPVDVRLNVMTCATTDGDAYLKIDYTDGSRYQLEEMQNRWKEGLGTCGTAWKTRTQVAYAYGAKRKELGFRRMGKKGAKARRLQSVLSTPVFWRDEVIAVLNLDSERPGQDTHVEEDWVQRIMRDAAHGIAPVLARD